MIFINHAANIVITKQTNFANSNIDKLNFLLAKILFYLSQFRFNVKYRFGKNHVIPDGLSRLSLNNGLTDFKLSRKFPADFLDLDNVFAEY